MTEFFFKLEVPEKYNFFFQIRGAGKYFFFKLGVPEKCYYFFKLEVQEKFQFFKLDRGARIF